MAKFQNWLGDRRAGKLFYAVSESVPVAIAGTCGNESLLSPKLRTHPLVRKGLPDRLPAGRRTWIRSLDANIQSLICR